MRYIENLESVNKKMIIDENGLKITQDAILLSEFIFPPFFPCTMTKSIFLYLFTLTDNIFNLFS